MTGLVNGRAVSMLLAEDGASVVCVDRVEAHARRTVEMIHDELSRRDGVTTSGKRGGRAIAIEANVTREDECRRVIEAAISNFQRLDILVNNVGILGAKGTAVGLDPAAWTTGLAVNVTSMMLMARFAIPEMTKTSPAEGDSPIRGSIINIGSVAGLQGGTPHLMYPTSKGAVVNMTRAMAAHHGREGIRVNCVCPGEFVMVARVASNFFLPSKAP